MSDVPFQQIPLTWRVPGTYMEIDSSLATSGAGAFPLRVLVLAQKLAAGALAALTPTRITSEEEAEAAAGAGSMAARMIAAFLSVTRSIELDVVLLGDLPAGVSAIGTLDFSGASSGGTLFLYIGGVRIPVDASGTPAQIATKVAAAITATRGVPVVAAVNPGLGTQVILTSRHKGEVGNSIDVRTSHLDGESDPYGLTITVGEMAGGSGNPDIIAALAAVGGIQYDVFVHPYTDSANLGVLETELSSRADAMTAIPGWAITGAVGSQGVLAALGDTRNSEFSTILGLEAYPGVPCERAAAVAAHVAFQGGIDPARPFQTLSVPGYAPSKQDQLTDAQRDLLLHDGIAVMTYDRVGTPRIGRLITTYQTTAAGAPSEAYLDVNTVLTLSYIRKSFVARFASRFPRSKLAADGGKAPAPGSSLVTPSVAKSEAVSWYQELLAAGLVEDLDGFKANSSFQIAGPDRLDIVLAIYLVSPLRMIAALNQFRR